MYKICTLLSTDNVDNDLLASTAAGRKALLHAASGAEALGALAYGPMTGRSAKVRMDG
jgi:hypothetical protein